MTLRNRIRSQTRRSPKRSPLEIAKEFLDLWNSALDVAWKVAPVSLVPAGLLLWSHLQSIGWISLFGESATSSSGLIFLVLAAIIFGLVTLLGFVLPSMFIVWTAHFYDLNHPIPKPALHLYAYALLTWFGILLVDIIFQTSMPPWLLFAFPVVVGMVFVAYKRSELAISGVGTRWTLRDYWKVPALAVLAALAVSVTTFPILIALNIGSQFKELSLAEEWLVVAMCFLVSLIGTIPGFIYLKLRTVHSGNQRPLKVAFAGVFLVLYMLVSALAFVPNVRSNFLRGAGVYSNDQTSFQILNKDLSFALTRAGMSVTKDAEQKSVEAYVRYHFGGIKLLCRDPYEPLSTAHPPAKPAKTAGRNVTAIGCVRTVPDDLREYSPIPLRPEAALQPVPK